MNAPSALKVECAENCGNSPKKQLLKELSIAYAKHDISFCLDWFTDDVVWDLVGAKQIRGKEAYEQALQQEKEHEVQHLRIDHIITHGNTGAVNGTLRLKDKQNIAFCDVYHFRGFGKTAKIKAITSYVIPVDPGGVSGNV